METFWFYFALMTVIGFFFAAVLLHLIAYRHVSLRACIFLILVAFATAGPMAAIGLLWPMVMWIWGFECIGGACFAHVCLRPDYEGRLGAKSLWSALLLIPVLGAALYLVFSASPVEEWAARRTRHSNAVAAKWIVELIFGL